MDFGHLLSPLKKIKFWSEVANPTGWPSLSCYLVLSRFISQGLAQFEHTSCFDYRLINSPVHFMDLDMGLPTTAAGMATGHRQACQRKRTEWGFTLLDSLYHKMATWQWKSCLQSHTSAFKFQNPIKMTVWKKLVDVTRPQIELQGSGMTHGEWEIVHRSLLRSDNTA